METEQAQTAIKWILNGYRHFFTNYEASPANLALFIGGHIGIALGILLVGFLLVFLLHLARFLGKTALVLGIAGGSLYIGYNNWDYITSFMFT